MLGQVHILILMLKIMIKIHSLAFMIVWEYQNTKFVFAKVNIRKTFLLLKKVKNDEHI